MTIEQLSARSVIDWFRLIEDLRGRSYSYRNIHALTGISIGSLTGYCNGGSPSHQHGEAIISLWLTATRRSRDDLPITTKQLSASNVM